jgi:hypothetical protein
MMILNEVANATCAERRGNFIQRFGDLAGVEQAIIDRVKARVLAQVTVLTSEDRFRLLVLEAFDQAKKPEDPRVAEEKRRRAYAEHEAEQAGLTDGQVDAVRDLVFGSHDGLTVDRDEFEEIVDDIINRVARP